MGELISRLGALIVASIVGTGGAGLANVIIGNVSSGCAILVDSASGAVKTQKKILILQTVAQFFYMASSIVLKGYSATVQNAVAVVRNIIAMKGRQSNTIELILIALPVILGLFLNNRGIIGLLPVMANLEYTIAVFRYAEQPLKLKMAFNMFNAMFMVFNFYLMNFVGAIGSIVIIVTTTVSMIKSKKAGKSEE